MTGKQLKKLLDENGWRLDRISGSHHIKDTGLFQSHFIVTQTCPRGC